MTNPRGQITEEKLAWLLAREQRDLADGPKPSRCTHDSTGLGERREVFGVEGISQQSSSHEQLTPAG